MHQADCMAARIEYERWAKTKSTSTSFKTTPAKNTYSKSAKMQKLGAIASKGEAGAAMKMFDDLFGDKK